MVVGEVLGHLGGQVARKNAGQPAPHVARLLLGEEVVVDAVDHDPGKREPLPLDHVVKPDRLVDGFAVRRGDQDERRGWGAQQLLDAGGSLAEVLGHAGQEPEELAQVGHQVDARDPAQRGQQGRCAKAKHPHAEPGGTHQRPWPDLP